MPGAKTDIKLPKRIEIDGIGFDPLTQDAAIERVEHWLRAPRRKNSYRIVKPYVEFFRGVRKDPTIAEAVNSADLVLADSVAVQWAAAFLAESNPSFGRWVWSWSRGLRQDKWVSSIIPERGAGATATHQWLLAAAQNGWRVGILGGNDAERTETVIKEKYPLLQLAGVWSGYFDGRGEGRLVKQLEAAKLDILFVAMGFPKQELFMYKHRAAGLARIMIGEGGTFDYREMGGTVGRAPQAFRAVGLEWAWRLARQPWRIGRQMTIPGIYVANLSIASSLSKFLVPLSLCGRSDPGFPGV